MWWKNLNNTWKGVIIGGVTFFLSIFGMIFYIFYFLGGVITMAALNSLAILACVKLTWGLTSGYFIGSLFGKKK